MDGGTLKRGVKGRVKGTYVFRLALLLPMERVVVALKRTDGVCVFGKKNPSRDGGRIGGNRCPGGWIEVEGSEKSPGEGEERKGNGKIMGRKGEDDPQRCPT